MSNWNYAVLNFIEDEPGVWLGHVNGEWVPGYGEILDHYGASGWELISFTPMNWDNGTPQPLALLPMGLQQVPKEECQQVLASDFPTFVSSNGLGHVTGMQAIFKRPV